MVEEDLVALLEGATERVYPLHAPEDPTYPLIVYQRLSRVGVKAHDGPPGLAAPRFEVACYDTTYSLAKQLTQDVRDIIDGYRLGDINSISVENEYDVDEEVPDVFRVNVDIRIWCQE